LVSRLDERRFLARTDSKVEASKSEQKVCCEHRKTHTPPKNVTPVLQIVILGNTGKYWEIMGNTGKYLENPGNTPQTGGRYWEILGKAGKYWKILGNIGKYWEILGNTGKYPENPGNTPQTGGRY
jgi:hypothetical protein